MRRSPARGNAGFAADFGRCVATLPDRPLAPAVLRPHPVTGISACLVFTLAMAAEASGRTPPAGQEQKAEPTAAADAPRDVTVSSLMRTVAAQQSLLEEQGRQIEQLRREMAAIQAAVQHPPGAAAVVAVASSQPASGPAVPGQGDEQGTPHFPELPPDLVTAGDFPGSFKLPGSDAALKIGGMVRVNWLSTYDPLQVDDRFQTSAIPMPGTSAGEGGGRVNIIAEPSRFNFDLRTPTGVGYMRAFIEGDFDGSKTTLRLRHAYGQWRRFIFGQTWSTFADPEAEPPGIDFEGLNAIVRFRQPQVRWSSPALRSHPPGARPRRSDSRNHECDRHQPGSGLRRESTRWDPARGGHLQFATLDRQLRAQSTDTPSDIVSTGAYGVNFSGKLPLPYREKRDQLLFQYNAGHGIGRYVSDLRSLGGSDAVFDETANTLRPLNVSAGFVGLEHWWARRFRSSASYGFVDVQNLDIQPDDALHLTRRSSINFMWSPIPRLDLVTEFLWGTRQNKNGDHGFAAQTQFGSTFRF